MNQSNSLHLLLLLQKVLETVSFQHFCLHDIEYLAKLSMPNLHIIKLRFENVFFIKSLEPFLLKFHWHLLKYPTKNVKS